MQKNNFVYYFWLVWYFIKKSPEIVFLLVYREILYIRMIIYNFFGV